MPLGFSRLSDLKVNRHGCPMSRLRLYVLVCTFRSASPIAAWQSVRKCGSMRDALQGLEGVLVRNANGLRVVITVNLIQQSVAVELDADAVEPL